MKKVTRVPSSEIIALVAAALGESPEDTAGRGAEALTLIYDLIEQNDIGNRSELSVLCSRVGAATEILDTLQRAGTDDYIDGDPAAADALRVRLLQQQEVTSLLIRRCETSLDLGKDQGSEQS